MEYIISTSQDHLVSLPTEVPSLSGAPQSMSHWQSQSASLGQHGDSVVTAWGNDDCWLWSHTDLGSSSATSCCSMCRPGVCPCSSRFHPTFHEGVDERPDTQLQVATPASSGPNGAYEEGLF